MTSFQQDRQKRLSANQWRFIGGQFIRHPWITCGLVVLSLVQACSEAIAALLVAIILQQGGSGGNVFAMGEGVLGRLGQFITAFDGHDRILVVGVSMAVLALVRLATTVGSTYLSVLLKSMVSCQTQDMVHAHLLAAPLDQVETMETGDVMATVILHSDRVGTMVMAVATFIPRVVTMATLIGLLIDVSPATAGVMFSVMLFPWLINRYLLAWLRRLAKLRTQLSGGTQQFMVETFCGLREVRAAVQESRRHGEFIKAMHHHRQVTIHANTIQAAVPNVSESLGLFGVGIILAVAAIVLSGRSENWLGDLLIALFLMVRLLPAGSAISGLKSRLTDCASAYEHVLAFLHKTRADAEDESGEPFTELGDGIVFDKVSLSYLEGKRPALKNVSFSIKPRGFLVIVGGSGAGKSSLLQALLRFRTPDDGRILVGGRDLSGIARASWRTHVGLVAQEPFLFNTSIGANIAFKRPDATSEEIEQAARQAEIHDFIITLEQGYDTPVGDRGVALSGGQRQRIAIARALLAKPAMLVLDEATSALDATTELQVLDTLQRIAKDIPVVMVTHRLAAARRADLLVVLDKGELAGVGAPEVMSQPGYCPAYEVLLNSYSAT